jgi:hypothetical protein
MPLMIEFFAVIGIFVTTMVYVSIRGGAAAQRQQAPTRRDLGE